MWKSTVCYSLKKGVRSRAGAADPLYYTNVLPASFLAESPSSSQDALLSGPWQQRHVLSDWTGVDRTQLPGVSSTVHQIQFIFRLLFSYMLFRASPCQGCSAATLFISNSRIKHLCDSVRSVWRNLLLHPPQPSLDFLSMSYFRRKRDTEALQHIWNIMLCLFEISS